MEKLSTALQTTHYTKPLNTSGSGLKNTNTKTLAEVQAIAHKLVDRLDNPSRFALYCKFAWNLPEARIWSNLETALAGRSPQRLFTWLCQRELPAANPSWPVVQSCGSN